MKKSILIISRPDHLNGECGELAAEGVETIRSEPSVVALNALMENDFTAVIMDPRGDIDRAVTLTEIIRSIRPGTPVFMNRSGVPFQRAVRLAGLEVLFLDESQRGPGGSGLMHVLRSASARFSDQDGKHPPAGPAAGGGI